MKCSLRIYFFTIVILCSTLCSFAGITEDYPTLAIGARAPDFTLLGVDGKTYSLESFKKSEILAIVFTCNHCPTAQAYEDRIIQIVKDYKDRGTSIVAISPNDPKSVNLNELGYTDLSDSYAEMKIRAKEKGYNFPYLYDGETQSVSKAYGPVATPHIFIFDKNRNLAYQGRIDDSENPQKKPGTADARNALEALLAGQKVPVASTKVFGCSVKWAEKKEVVQKVYDNWAKEAVRIESIDETTLQDIFENKSDKLRLITIWSTDCEVCKTTFNEFVTINRMYRNRDFEFVSICSQKTDKEKVLRFLTSQQASNRNYIFSDNNRLKALIKTKWKGDLPYTLLIEPGGKTVYAEQGPIDAARMKKTIVENSLIGRYY